VSDPSPASWYQCQAQRGLLLLHVHVQPNARRTEIAGLHGSRLKLRLAAPAAEGRANALLVGFLARLFDLPGAQVMIRHGLHGRTKTVEIHGQAACLLARAKELLHS
jgi:uncharacterized protein (TIGR00251 family)